MFFLIAMGTGSHYTAYKHAVMGLTKAVALEYGPDNIRCVAVVPGFIKTAMTDGIFREEEAMLAAMVPLQRAGDPKEVANLVLWLASDQASYVNGSVHQVDAGLLAGFAFSA